jgi:hypothetical protein
MQSTGNKWHSISTGQEICHGITLSFEISIFFCSWRKLFATSKSVTLSIDIVSHSSCRQGSCVWLFILALNSSVVFIAIEHNIKHNNNVSFLTFFDIFLLYNAILIQWRQYYIIQVKSILRIFCQNNSSRTQRNLNNLMQLNCFVYGHQMKLISGMNLLITYSRGTLRGWTRLLTAY